VEACLRDAPYDFATLFTFVLGNASAKPRPPLTRKLSREGGSAKKRMRDSMAKARKIATQFPRLRARLNTAAAEYGAAPEQSFEFWPSIPSRRPRSPN